MLYYLIPILNMHLSLQIKKNVMYIYSFNDDQFTLYKEQLYMFQLVQLQIPSCSGILIVNFLIWEIMMIIQ